MYRNVMIECLERMLTPIVSFCLRRSLALQDLIQIARRVFLKIAAKEMRAQGKDPTVSALSVITGMHRKGIVQILREKEDDELNLPNFATRVIGQWRNDKKFLTPSGKPKVLNFGTLDSEFSKLVEVVSKDLYPSSVLFELERIRAVQRTKNGLRLIAHSYQSRREPLGSFSFLAEDVNDLITVVEENTFTTEKVLPHFHGTVVYDKISDDKIKEVRRWLFKESAAFQKRVDRYLSKYDLDIRPKISKTGGRRVVLGIFSRM